MTANVFQHHPVANQDPPYTVSSSEINSTHARGGKMMKIQYYYYGASARGDAYL